MQETGPARNTPTRAAVLKILYLVAVTAAAFAVPAAEATRPARWYLVPCLLALQLLLLAWCGVPARELARSAWRLKWLFVVLLACYAFLPADGGAGDEGRVVPVPFTGRPVAVNAGGLAQAGLMCLQVLTVILASAVVRLTGPGTDLANGLRALRLPTLFVHALDQTLGLLGGIGRPGEGRGDGSGGGRNRKGPGAGAAQPSPGFFALVRRLVRGDVGLFAEAVRGSLDRAKAQVRQGGRLDERQAHDVVVLAGIAGVMASLKMLKTLPGVPFAAGHKTLLLFPLYILAARLTYSRWGATAAGAVMGVIGFLQGDGRFGALEVFKHLAPGVVIDLLMPAVRRLPERAWVYCALGLVAGAARSATDFAVVLLLGARAEVFIFPTAKLLPTLLAGLLSGFVAVVVLKAFPAGPPPAPPPGSENPPAAIDAAPATHSEASKEA